MEIKKIPRLFAELTFIMSINVLIAIITMI